MGKAVVSLAPGAEGLHLRNGDEAIIVETAREFRDAVVTLIENDQQRERIEKQARERVERDYSWQRIGRTLRELYDKLNETSQNPED